MCDEIIIIAKGKLLAYDTTENLEKMLQPKIVLEVQTDASQEESESILDTVEGIEKTEYQDDPDGFLTILLTTAPEKELEIRKSLSLKFASIGRAVLKNEKMKADLEEIFIELTTQESEQPGSHQEKEEEKK